MDVSIVIVNWNTREVTCDCIESLYDQTRSLEFEVVVIDNASADDSVEAIRRQFPDVILIENKDNRGFAAANNQGLAIAQGRYVLLLNSDTVVLDNAIEKAVEFADTRGDAAVIGCRVLNPDKSLQPTCFMFPSVLNMLLSTTYLYKIFPRSRFFGRERMGWWNRDDVREVGVVTGCFMLTRREAIEQVGMMDEDFFMYGEETDWCYRFKQAGWKVMFTPAMEIIHLGGQSSKQVQVDMLIQLRMSILQFMKKNRGPLKYLVAKMLTILFWGGRIPFWYLIAIFNINKRDNALQIIKAYRKGISQLFSRRLVSHDGL
jgi:GT2 family glycosyltransferase